jgi:hypothetical protein
MRGWRKPKYDPATLRGRAIMAQRAIRVIMVPKGTAPEEWEWIKKRFIENKKLKIQPGTRVAVSKMFIFQFSPPFIL